MIAPIGLGRLEAISLRATAGPSAGPSGLAAGAITTLSTRIAQTIAGELGLARRADALANPGGSGGDLYGVGRLAEELAGALGATPTQAGVLSRMLHDLAGEVAASFAARPESATIERFSKLPGAQDGDAARNNVSPIDQAMATIDAALIRLREDGPWTPGR